MINTSTDYYKNNNIFFCFIVNFFQLQNNNLPIRISNRKQDNIFVLAIRY